MFFARAYAVTAAIALSMTATCSAQTAELVTAPTRPQTTEPSLNTSSASYEPITFRGRLSWVTYNTVGPTNLLANAFKAGRATMVNRPFEYGPHWSGFGERYAYRMVGHATNNLMEAGLGAIWGEDPRYRRSGQGTTFQRAGYAARNAFLSHNRKGDLMPAYARYVAIPGANVLSNTWRAHSQVTVSDTMLRIGMGFTSRVISNTFNEFWPDIKVAAFEHKK